MGILMFILKVTYIFQQKNQQNSKTYITIQLLYDIHMEGVEMGRWKNSPQIIDMGK